MSQMAKLDLNTDEESSKVMAKYFLAINKDLLTSAELGKLVEAIRTDDFAVPFVEAIWNMLQQKYRKTLFLADEHGAKFEKKYLINGIYEWIEFVGPSPEDIFD